MLGSLLSHGDHLYLNRESEGWEYALRRLVAITNDVKESSGAEMIFMRDFYKHDIRIRDFFLAEGFVSVDMNSDHILENLAWHSDDSFAQSLSSKSRVHQKKNILPFQSLFNVQVKQRIDSDELEQIIDLYKQVKERAFELNTFELPLKFFKNLDSCDHWEIIQLSLREVPDKLVGVGICYRSPAGNYTPLVAGVDYRLNKHYSVYRQILFQAVKRAAQLKSKKIYLGFGADVEKHKFGTKTLNRVAFIQSGDNFKMESLEVYKNLTS